MSDLFEFKAADVGCVTVTFNPDVALLGKQLAAIPPACLKVLVDNASEEKTYRDISRLIANVPNAVLLRNENNVGLAAAINIGAKKMKQVDRTPRFLLLLDQDSEPADGGIEKLVTAFVSLQAAGESVGIVGPRLIDPDTGLQHGFHRTTRWRWVREFPSNDSTEPIACTNINGSGTLMPLQLFLDLGGLEETLFIDHIDTEWSFRVLASGHTLWGIPDAFFRHHMGERAGRFWLFGWRVWPMRSPSRHYYLFRNAIRLMRRKYVHDTWKFWNVVKLILTALVHLVIDKKRAAQLKAMWKGVKDGLRS